MENTILNTKPFSVFVILAETLAGWKSPVTPEGKVVLQEHYAWGARLKADGKLILAGPLDFEQIASGAINPISHTTGLILIQAESKEEAEEYAYSDPFHTHGFRKNDVHALKISMTENSIFETLEKLIHQF